MKGVRTKPYPLLVFLLASKDKELALSLLYQNGLTTLEEIKRKAHLEIRGQVPPRRSPQALLKKIRIQEKKWLGKTIFKNIRTVYVKSQAWVQRYQRFLTPFPLIKSKNSKYSNELYIIPKASRGQKPPKDGLFIQSDLAFGTGTHPTTQLCASYLNDLLSLCPENSVLDMGCGTGILAMVAKKFGADPVYAVDNDPLARQVARKNFRLNSLKDITLRPNLHRVRKKFDIIVTNISLQVLMEIKHLLVSHLLKKGNLILSGVLYRDCPELREAYQSLSFRSRKNKSGWAALHFQKEI